jgi:hypothetical protein
VLVDPESRRARSIVEPSDDSLLQPVVAPDGTRIAFYRGSEKSGEGLWTVSLRDGAQKRIGDRAELPFGWSPDGAQIFATEVDFAANKASRIVAYPSGGGERTLVTRLPAPDGADAVALVPGTGQLLALVSTSRSDVWVASEDDLPIARGFTPVVAPAKQETMPRPAPLNLGFEEGQPGQPPPGWIIKEGARLSIVAEDAREGKRCALLEGQESVTTGQRLIAKPYAGRRVRLSAWVRTEPESPDVRAELWLNVRRTDGTTGFAADMADRPIRSRRWARYEITGTIDPDAERIDFGLVLYGQGRAWLDGVAFGRIDERSP